jgi:hypothetical protein
MKRLALMFAVVMLLAAPACTGLPGVATNPPVVIAFSASPTNVVIGQPVTLLWNVTGADTVRIDPGLGIVPAAGTQTVMPQLSTAYVLTATNTAGTTAQSVTVIATASQPNPPMISVFQVSPATISPGQSATITWNVSNATSVTIDQGIGQVAASGSRTVSPGFTTVYTLTAANNSSSINHSQILSVMSASSGQLPNITIFEVYPSYIPTTVTVGPVMIKWKVLNATSVRIDPNIGSVSDQGQYTDYPYTTTTYTIVATNDAGSVTQSGTVYIYGYWPPGYQLPVPPGLSVPPAYP